MTVRIVLLRNHAHGIVEAYSDSDETVELHFADADLSEPDVNERLLQLPNGEDRIVDHWSMDVASEPEMVNAFLSETMYREPTAPEPIPDSLYEDRTGPVEEPLVLQQGMCQFCHEPAVVAAGGIIACAKCDGPPEP